jgi:hypothetical protein
MDKSRLHINVENRRSYLRFDPDQHRRTVGKKVVGSAVGAVDVR